MSRWHSAALGVTASLGLSAAVWIVFDWPVLFLAVPFVPFLFWRRGSDAAGGARRCPECGFISRDPAVRYCPHDGHHLEGESPAP